jgi:hypothetical protein
MKSRLRCTSEALFLSLANGQTAYYSLPAARPHPLKQMTAAMVVDSSKIHRIERKQGRTLQCELQLQCKWGRRHGGAQQQGSE